MSLYHLIDDEAVFANFDGLVEVDHCLHVSVLVNEGVLLLESQLRVLIWIAVFEVNLEPLEKLYHFLVVVPCPNYHLIGNFVGQIGAPVVIGRLGLLEGVLVLVCESFSQLQWAFVQLDQFIFAKVPVALF